mgnify:CR=1 FL=1
MYARQILMNALHYIYESTSIIVFPSAEVDAIYLLLGKINEFRHD